MLVRPSLIATVRRTHSATRPGRGDDEQDGDAELGVGRLQGVEHARRRRRCPAPRSARRPAARAASSPARWRCAIRCCSPPDIWPGVRSAQCATPSAAEQLVGPPARSLGARGAGQPHRQMHVLRGGQVRQQVARGLLPDEADDRAAVAEPLPRGHERAEVVPGDPHAARGRRVETGEDVHQRGLAAARRADQRGQLARLRPAGQDPAAPAPRCRRPSRSAPRRSHTISASAP